MNSKVMVGLTALLLAAVATMSVFLYIRGVQKQARSTDDRVEVVVSKQDILAGTALDDLIQGGALRVMMVSQDALVDGAVTSLSELQNKQASTAILAGEQISTARLEGSNQLPGGVLGIPAGYTATTIGLDDFRLVGGAVQGGDHVTVYGTFEPKGGDSFTVTLVPDAQVLKVDAGSNGGLGSANDEAGITFALKPADAQKLIFGKEKGALWLALVPPNERGVKTPITTIRRVAR